MPETSAFDMLTSFNNPELLQQSSEDNQQQQHNHDDDLLNEFLDTRIYNNSNNNSRPNVSIKEELPSPDQQDINGFAFQPTATPNMDFYQTDVTSDQKDLIDSLLSQNYLENSSHILEDTDQIFKINSSNDSNNSIVHPQTPTPNDTNYEVFDHQQNMDVMDIDYSFNEYVKIADVQSEEFKLYEESRKELMKLKFGGPKNQNNGILNTTIPSHVKTEDSELANMDSYEVPEEYYNTANDANLPYNLKISGLPDHSRVETQIKLSLSISPPPPQFLLQLPADTISKTKLKLQEEVPESSKKHILYLDTYVLTSGQESAANNAPLKQEMAKEMTNSPTSEGASPNSNITSNDTTQLNPSMKSCNICSRCIRRELKRASRRKNGTLEDGFNWNLMGPKRAVIFNCKEIISFPPPTVGSPLSNKSNGDELNDYLANVDENNNNKLESEKEKKIEISSRIICYCRHHSESKGFRLFFVLKNSDGEVLGKTFSDPIMIMDRKKSTVSGKSLPNSTDIKKDHLLSPTSLEESSSEAQTNASDYSRPSKRKRAWSPTATGSGSTSTYYDGISQQRSLSSANTTVTRKDGFSPTDSEHQRSPNMFHNTPQRAESITSITSNSSSYVGNKAAAPLIPSTISYSANSNQPYIQRIIPAQGPIRGGIEVTLLGSKFRPGLVVKFGANQALTTHCWSDSTIVTYLPPASNPGQVMVTFDNFSSDNKHPIQQQVFTYTDDTDRQLIELALQIVGLKMNGKLEDAKNIAKRIIGNSNDSTNTASTPLNDKNGSGAVEEVDDEWFSKATETVKQLSQSSSDSEEVLLKFLSLLDLPNAPISSPNWAVCTTEGQTLLHLASIRNYYKLVLYLINRGSRIDYKDVNDFTPLHLAFLNGNREIIEVLIKCGAKVNNRIKKNVTLQQISNSNVLDLINEEITGSTIDEFNSHQRSSSSDSITSMFNDIDDNLRQHVSRMVADDAVVDKFSTDTVSDDTHDEFDEDDEDLSGDETNTEERVDVQQEDLPNYDDLFPSSSSLKSLIKSVTGGSKTVEETTEAELEIVNKSEEVTHSDDRFLRFFLNNSQRTTPIMRDRMLFFFWLPLLLITFILIMGSNHNWVLDEQFDKCNEFIRYNLLNFMLGRSRVEGVINSVNAAVTAGLNNMTG